MSILTILWGWISVGMGGESKETLLENALKYLTIGVGGGIQDNSRITGRILTNSSFEA